MTCAHQPKHELDQLLTRSYAAILRSFLQAHSDPHEPLAVWGLARVVPGPGSNLRMYCILLQVQVRTLPIELAPTR